MLKKGSRNNPSQNCRAHSSGFILDSLEESENNDYIVCYIDNTTPSFGVSLSMILCFHSPPSIKVLEKCFKSQYAQNSQLLQKNWVQITGCLVETMSPLIWVLDRNHATSHLTHSETLIKIYFCTYLERIKHCLKRCSKLFPPAPSHWRDVISWKECVNDSNRSEHAQNKNDYVMFRWVICEGKKM